jgi:UDP-N-acetylmuramoylalanine--D-glutamate ligase
MNSSNLPQQIGIWGFGKTGKSALTFFAQRGTRCTIFDARRLSDAEIAMISAQGGIYNAAHSLEDFLHGQPLVLASPGIDSNSYRHITTFITELDLFYAFWNKPIIAVTGSIGKTSTTTIAQRLLSQFAPCVVGGNIGTPMLDLLGNTHTVHPDYALLELSSWQLEHIQQFRPNIAIWTNLHPNHLDRHGTMQAYAQAKAQILRFQQADDTIIAPLELHDIITQYAHTQRMCYFTATAPDRARRTAVAPTASIIYATDNAIMCYHNGVEEQIMQRSDLPQQGFLDHWLIMLALSKQLQLNVNAEHLAAAATTVAHRLEPVASVFPGIYVNDSKSTTPTSTYAAVAHYAAHPVYLLLGGLSKGVDRSAMMAQLQRTVIKELVCFGKEAPQLAQWAMAHGHYATAHATLHDAMTYIIARVSANDVVLLSPAGSSYDLYRDYEERGNHFKLLCMGTSA